MRTPIGAKGLASFDSKMDRNMAYRGKSISTAASQLKPDPIRRSTHSLDALHLGTDVATGPARV
jgi:hypothetical protein